MKIFKRLVLLNGEYDKLVRWETTKVTFLGKWGLIASSKSLIGAYV